MLIDGKYEVERVLGEGAMGIVYLAHDAATDTKVVVKSIRAEFADNPEFQGRAIDEGRALAHIDHPNVVRLNAVVVEQGQLYLVMQYIEGNSLERLIEAYRAQGAQVPLDEAVRLFRMMVQGVAAAHHEGVIHRDIKPANILVRAKDGVVKVSDFGIAKTGAAFRTGRQRTVGVVGSPAYMAPEQRAGIPDLDRRADIYSLGIVFFELLTGTLPFVAATASELFRLHSEAALPSVCRLRPELPPGIDAILARACAKDRRDRFSTCEELDAALLYGGLPITRSVPPTVMATQGLPSFPPPATPSHVSEPPAYTSPLPPRASAPSRVAMTISDAPLAAPSFSPPPGAAERKIWKYVAIGGGLLLLLAGGGLGLAFATGAFDDPAPPLVDPPKARDAGVAATKATAAAAPTVKPAGAAANTTGRVDAGKTGR
jgi:serine/threonine-protein kinase